MLHLVMLGKPLNVLYYAICIKCSFVGWFWLLVLIINARVHHVLFPCFWVVGVSEEFLFVKLTYGVHFSVQYLHTLYFKLYT